MTAAAAPPGPFPDRSKPLTTHLLDPPTDTTAAPPVEGALPDPPELVIRPKSAWGLLDLRELWRYRELLFFLAWRDVKIRYKQTVLGLGWAVLQPVLLMLAFVGFLSRHANLSSGDIPYPLFVLCGLVPWTFFTTAVT